jgi:predicted anti-sigma-YlaC factor YlaD
MPTNDSDNMTCDQCQDAISAMADGEDPGVLPGDVDGHLAGCTRCRAFREAVERSSGGALSIAPEMPDLSRAVTKRVAIADRAAAVSITRVLLAVVAVEILVLSVPNLAAGDEVGPSAHDSRHLGAFSIAYAVALLAVVVRPARARTVLPVAAVLAGALVITAIVDLVNGNVPLLGEALHLPEVLSVGLVWLLANPPRRRPRPVPTSPRLQAVDQSEPTRRSD